MIRCECGRRLKTGCAHDEHKRLLGPGHNVLCSRCGESLPYPIGPKTFKGMIVQIKSLGIPLAILCETCRDQVVAQREDPIAQVKAKKY
jgi:hypothetical protein